MLTDDQYATIGHLNLQTQIALTSVASMFSIPKLPSRVLDRQSKVRGLASFGSKILDKYHKKVTLNLPPVLYDPAHQSKRAEACSDTAALIAAGFLGSVYETLRSNAGVQNSATNPLWQFLRHVRNGCFHGNMFSFRSSEPRHPAAWRGLEITKSLNGTTLIYDFIGIGDIFILVADIIESIGVPPGRKPVWESTPPDWTLKP